MPAMELNNTILKNSANLKAYYRMEAGALTTDSSGNANTLTNTNTVAEGVGVFGVCADFGASNTNKELNHTSDYAINGGVCTLGGWFKVTTYPTSGNAAVPLYMSDDTSKTWFQIVHYNNSGTKQIAFHRAKNGVAQEGVAYFNYDPGTDWHFYVMTYDGTNVRCYIDGAYRGIGAASGNGSAATTQKFSIGNSGHSGLVDDVFIFNIALTADQIKELYEGRIVGEGWPQANLVGLWHFNGDSTDSSGNNWTRTDTAMSYSLANGKFGQGAGFNGSSSNVFIANNLGIDGGVITISCWIRLGAEIGSGRWCFVETGSDNTDVYYRVEYEYNSGTRRLVFNRTRAAVAEQSYVYNITLGTSNWYHLVLTYDATNIIGYMNGALVAQGVASGNGTGTNPTGTYFGRINYSPAPEYYNGSLDEVQIFNVVKDANWVRKQYAWSRGKFL